MYRIDGSNDVSTNMAVQGFVRMLQGTVFIRRLEGGIFDNPEFSRVDITRGYVHVKRLNP